MIGNISKKIDQANTSIIFVALVIAYFLLPLYSSTSFSCGDVTLYTSVPLRLLSGDLPYRDFWQLYPPGNLYIGALVYQISNVNINALFAASIFITALAGALAFLCGKMIFKRNSYALLISAMVFFNGTFAWYEGPRFRHVYILMQIAAAIFLIKFFDAKRDMHLFLSGIFLGAAAFFRVYEAAASILAFAIVAAYFSYEKRGLLKPAKSSAIIIAGSAIAICLLMLPLIGVWQLAFKETVFDSVSHISSLSSDQNYPYFIDTMRHIAALAGSSGLRFAYNLAGAAMTFIIYLIPIAAAAGFIWYARQKPDKKELAIALTFLLWGIFTLPKSITPVVAHLAQTTTPMMFVMLIAMRKMHGIKGKSRALYYFIAICSIAMLVPFTLISMTAHVATETKYEVSTSHGMLLFSNQSEAESAMSVLSYIQNNTNESDYIFSSRLCAPSFYALANRRNPTYYDTIGDVIIRNSTEKQSSICSYLLEKGTKVIIFSPDQRTLDSAQILVSCIKDNFKLKETFGLYEIYGR
jgi:hypothetical protein